MALGFGNAVELLFTARDEASKKIQLLSAEVGGLGRAAGIASASATPLLALAGAAIAASGAIFALARAFADEVEQLDNTSARLGVAVPNIQALSAALKMQGASGDAATVALQFLNRAIATHDPLLKQLGISTTNVWEAFQQLTKILSGSAEGSARTEVAIRLMGRSAGEALGPLLLLAEKMPTLTEDMRKLGVVSGEAQLAAGRLLDQRLDAINVRLAGLMNQAKAFAAELALTVFDPATRKLIEAGFDPFEIGTLGKAQEAMLGPADAPNNLGAALDAVDPKMEEARKKAEALRKAQEALAKATREAAAEFRKQQIDAFNAGRPMGPATEADFFRSMLRPDLQPTAIPGLGVPGGNKGLGQATAMMQRQQSDALRDLAGVAVSAATSVAGSMESIFANFNNKMQTIGSAARTFWNSLVSDISAAIGRLLARLALVAGLNVLGGFIGLPGLGSLTFGGGGGLGTIVPALGGPTSAGSSRGGDTYVVSGLNTRDLVMELRNPGGQLRRAQDRVALATGY